MQDVVFVIGTSRQEEKKKEKKETLTQAWKAFNFDKRSRGKF